MSKVAFITGITGMDGAHLSELLLSKGYEVHGLLRRSSVSNTERLFGILDRVHLHYGDLTDGTGLSRILSDVQPDEIYNLGALSHVRVSYDCPEYTADATGVGAVRLLEAVRTAGLSGSARVYQASSSEMFGGLDCPAEGYNEQSAFHPRSPYGCAKVFAYHSTVNYREAYNMHASNGILFNHECVTAETPVMYRKNGWVDIAEIQELVPHRTDPKHGIKYQSTPNLEVFDGDKWSKVVVATATWNGGEKDVYKVEARGGFYCATGDHKSFLSGCLEIETKDLKPGDKLQLFLLPVRDRAGDAVMSAEEAEFLGLMAGDGYICSSGGSARFTNKDEQLLQRAAELFTRLSGGRARRSEDKVSGFTGETIPAMEFSGASSWFAVWRSEIYNERKMKKVPKRVLNAPNDIQDAFLRGYNAADGLKSKTCNAEFKCWGTNSPVLAAGLWFLGECLGLRVAMNWDAKRPEDFFALNVGEWALTKGAHLQKPLEEIKKCQKRAHTGWLFDLATESGTFSAGIGRTWLHNSPLRGENFVTKKIAKAVAQIEWGIQDHAALGNLDARRDWGWAPDYVEAMWAMLQQDTPDDYVIATGVAHSVQEFCQAAFEYRGLNWREFVVFDASFIRPAEVNVLIGDASKARRQLGWKPKVLFGEIVKRMVDSEIAAIENGTAL